MDWQPSRAEAAPEQVGCLQGDMQVAWDLGVGVGCLAPTRLALLLCRVCGILPSQLRVAEWQRAVLAYRYGRVWGGLVYDALQEIQAFAARAVP